MTYEESVVAEHSTPGLKRNQLTRDTKKLMMGFDAQFSGMTSADRDAFLDRMFPEEVPRGAENVIEPNVQS